MIYHNLRASFKADVTQEQKEAVVERLRDQGRVIEAVRSVGVGQDFGGEFTHAAIFTFSDLDDYQAYLSHPHRQQTEALFLPLTDKVDAFAFVDDPTFAQQVREVQTNARP